MGSWVNHGSCTRPHGDWLHVELPWGSRALHRPPFGAAIGGGPGKRCHGGMWDLLLSQASGVGVAHGCQNSHCWGLHQEAGCWSRHPQVKGPMPPGPGCCWGGITGLPCSGEGPGWNIRVKVDTGGTP